MSKEKQIDEMAKALNEATFGVNTQTLADHLKPETINKVAEYLYNAGYRKQSENTIELPCKVGAKVYQTDGVRIYESIINEITLTSNNKTIFVAENIVFDETAIGKGIFLTKEEAKTKGGAENDI